VSEKLTRADRRRKARQQRLRLKEEGAWYPKGFWPTFAAPATLWMLIFFITPFYAVFALAFGTVDPIWRNAVPVWNPLNWNPTTFNETVQKILPPPPNFFAPAFIRTIVFIIIASSLCLLVGYPVAYFVARYGGKYKNIYLVLLIAPFWISYMMRMLAWVNILQPDGYLNQLIEVLTPWSSAQVQYGWLEGHWFTVVLGIVYGYIPYMILPLYAGLDRISQSLLEASRDLGANGAKTFFRITLPLSKPAILAGLVIVTLPMMGDYYTNNLLSRRPTTTMVGNLIDNSVNTASRQSEGAVLVIILTIILIIPMLYYMRTTTKETERW
jgi:ABC-type spermidine/putrescine transport system permease subunit I